MTKNELSGAVFSTLFVSGDAIDVAAFAKYFDMDIDALDIMLQEIIEDGARREDGVLLVRVGDKVQLCTNQKYGDVVKELLAPEERTSLSAAVMETLSIIAYKQPVTRAEIDEIRGVRSNYAVATLKEKGLIQVIGRKDALGRPALLATTDEFLRHFGISSLEELPKIDFEALEEQQDETEESSLTT
ncbi:MAG: SMC-Scp complex subunit ScpB [Christensenella sp.]|uniref:SMC-Scp complex subunit ScpB n=1 Tax=Christensenella sp. TaxID=1935934 RepID=UPI002B1FA487|nr:SMC-Scp complex subunit ScpB [Christensenella sp.]MEA5003854.1 SMC-Scp complex subunit ScpB [Christensenella sp.]